MSVVHLPRLDTRRNPCLCCPPITAIADMDEVIAVGFGQATLERDGTVVLDGERAARFEDAATFADAEKIAAADPDHDWRVVLFAPLHGETYQRQDGAWYLVESNEGFA